MKRMEWKLMEKKLKSILSLIFISTIMIIWVLFFRFNQIELRSDEKAYFTVMPSPPTHKELNLDEISDVIKIVNSANKSFRGPYFMSGWQAKIDFKYKGKITILNDNHLVRKNIRYKVDKTVVDNLMEIYNNSTSEPIPWNVDPNYLDFK